MTRDEWLDTLAWHDGPPPGEPGHDWADTRPGMVYGLKDGTVEIVGTINEKGGGCGCCSGSPKLADVARWAEIFGGNP